MPGDDQDSFLALSEAALGDLGLSTLEIVDAIEAAIRTEAAGGVWTAPKSALLPGDGRYLMTTLSAADRPRLSVVKDVMVSPRNPDRGLPGIDGTIVVHDSETGQLRAVIGARWITAVRTAGLSAVVARRLANPASRAIAFVGCGVQARSHLEAFAALFPLAEVRAYGRGTQNVERLCALARDMGMEAKAAASPREALEGADLVVSSVTLSFEIEPFLDARWLKPGAFAAITDMALPWMPEGLSAFDSIIIDDERQEASSPKRMVGAELVTGEITALVSDALDCRFDPAKRAAFTFRGLAIGDFAIACLAYEKARDTGQGLKVAW
ncbi:MAG: ornithine cyclodeaminase family protein [Kiloniellales bacterium]